MEELDRLQVMTRIAERRLTRRRAAALLRLSERQVRRLYRAFAADGAAGLGVAPARAPERSPARGRDPRARPGPHARALRRLRADLRAPEAHRGARPRALRRDAARLDDRRRASGCRGRSGPAAATRRGERRACLGELVQIDGSRARLVRGPRPALHAAGLRRRCHEPAHGALLRRRRVHVRLLPRDAALPRAPRQADGLLQRPAAASSTSRPATAPRAARALAVRPRPARPQHRQPLRPQPAGEGPRRARQRDAAGSARQGAPPPRPQRSRPPPSRSCPASWPTTIAASPSPPRVAHDAHRAAPPGRRPRPDLHAPGDAADHAAAHRALQARPLRARGLASRIAACAARPRSSAKPPTAPSRFAATAACSPSGSTPRITRSSSPASSSSTSISTASSPGSPRSSASATPPASPTRRSRSGPSSAFGPRRRSPSVSPAIPEPSNPDISTWGKSGHFYFVLTSSSLLRPPRGRKRQSTPGVSGASACPAEGPDRGTEARRVTAPAPSRREKGRPVCRAAAQGDRCGMLHHLQAPPTRRLSTGGGDGPGVAEQAEEDARSSAARRGDHRSSR